MGYYEREIKNSFVDSIMWIMDLFYNTTTKLVRKLQ